MLLYETCFELQLGEYSETFKEYFIAKTDKDAKKIALECMKRKAFHSKLKKDKNSDWYYSPNDEYALRLRYYKEAPAIELANFSILTSNLSYELTNPNDPGIYVMFKAYKDKEGVLHFVNGDEIKPAYGMTQKHYKSFQFYIEFLLNRHL